MNVEKNSSIPAFQTPVFHSPCRLRLQTSHLVCPTKLPTSRRPLLSCASSGASALNEALKRQLCEIASDLDMGRKSMGDESKQTEIAAIVDELAINSPTAQPAQSVLVNGDWELIYTDSKDNLGMGRPEFLYASRLLQTIDTLKGSFKIEERGSLFSDLMQWKNVFEGDCKPSTSPSNSDVRLMLKFEVFKPLGMLTVKFPKDKPAIGWQDQIYLDQDMRIIKSNKGSTTVMVRTEL